MGKITAYGNITITDLTEPFSVLLTNEAQQFAVNSTRKVVNTQSYYTDIVVYQGTSERTDYVIGNISASSEISVSKTKTRVTFTVATGVTLPADTGVIIIPITLDGKTVNKTFSWSCAKQGVQGNTGASAKSIDITATTQVFKSTDGGQTFSPDAIKLTPTLQGGLTFLKWQYSLDGGLSWVDVTSGKNGLTITSGILTISKDSALFTDSITSICFKCITNNSTFYDVITLIRLYDVTDIQIGGRNLILNSKNEVSGIYNQENIFTWKKSTEVMLESGDIYTLSFLAKSSSGTDKVYFSFANNNSSQEYITPNNLLINNTSYQKYTLVNTIKLDSSKWNNLLFTSHNGWHGLTGNTGTVSIKQIKLEKGNKATDWTPAPEDIDNQFKETKNSITNLSTTVNNQKLEIQNKIGKTDLMTVTDSDGKVVKKTVADTLTQATQDINGFKKEVFQKYTTKAENSQTLTDAKSYADQTVNGFKSTVEKTYTKLTDFNNLQIGGRNLLYETASDKIAIQGYNEWHNHAAILTEDKLNGCYIYKTSGAWRGIEFYWNKIIDRANIKIGDILTYSIMARTDDTVDREIVLVANYSDNNNSSKLCTIKKTLLTNEWIKQEATLEYTQEIADNLKKGRNLRVGFEPTNVGSNNAYIYWTCPKLEFGNKATDWTPAPEDIDNSISSVKSYAEQTASKFSWLIDDKSTQTSITLSPNLITAITNQYVIKDSSGSATIIQGGKIKANSITSDMLATTAIKSKNYKAGTYSNGAGYSTLGTLLELDTGMIHTPGFYTDSLGNTFISGEIHALTGYFGSKEHNWFLGETTLTDIMNDDGALTNGDYSYLKATSNTAIVAGNWHLMAQSSDMAMRSGFTTLNGGNFVKNPVDGKYYDFGVVEPDMTKEAKEYNKKFLYIRRANSSQTHPQDWEYLFRVDYDGSIWYKGKLIAGEGGMFLSITGGTITGDLKVNGTLTATASAAKKVTSALTINGKSFDGSSAVNVGIIGTAYGGTGSSTVSGARANLSVLGTKNANGYYGLTKPDGTDSDWIRTTSNGILPYKSGSSSSLGTSAWHFSQAYIDTVYGNLDGLATKATQDASGNVITDTYLRKDFDTINQNVIFNNSVTIEDLAVGSLLVNGNARFVNGLKGNLTGDVTGNVTGNLAGIASQATKLQTVRKIGNANFDGTADITLAQIGASTSGHTHNYAGSASAGGAAYSANKLNTTFTITCGNTDKKTAGYRLLATKDITAWCNYRIVLLVRSRHNGAGIVSIAVGCNNSTVSQENLYAGIRYYGVQDCARAIISDAYQLYGSDDGKTAYLFAYWHDFSDINVTVIHSDLTLSNGTWVDSISTDTYGKQLTKTKINASSWSNIDDKPSTFTPSAHNHNSILDVNNGNQITISNSGMSYDSYTYLAGWSGNTLKAVDKSQFATSGHNHDISSLTNFSNYIYSAQASRTANTFLAAPNGSDGKASFRKIEIADLPSHTHPYVNKITLSGTAYNVSNNDITITKDNLISAIGVGTTAETSPTAVGLMTKSEREKLASITVSDIGTVGANSIKGTAPIGVSISNGVATITHGTSGVTAGSYGADSTNYFRIPKLTVDARGHVTGATYYDITGANLASRIGSNTVQNATNATKATQDASGNVITDTYMRKDVSEINQNITFNNSVTIEDLTVDSLLVNGNTRFVNGIKGNLVGNVTGNVTGNLSGNASTATTATKANLLTNMFSSRPTDANIAITGSGGVASFKATSSMTDNKPPHDAHVLHFYWDSIAGWDSQLAVGIGSVNSLFIRGQKSKTWSDWKTVLDSSNYTSYTVKKDGTGASGTWGINITGNSSTATKWKNARNLTIGNTKKSIDGGSDVSWSLSEIGALPLTGGTITGDVVFNKYILGESQSTGNIAHAILLGHQNQNYMNFYEYGGLFQFYKSVDGVNTLLGKITANGWEGNVVGNLTGKADSAKIADSATKATQDASGNVITTKYVAVDTTQTISGAKTFSNVLTVNNTTASTSKITGAVKIKGGVGVEGQVSADKMMIGDNCTLQMDEYGSLNFIFT